MRIKRSSVSAQSASFRKRHIKGNVVRSADEIFLELPVRPPGLRALFHGTQIDPYATGRDARAVWRTG